MSLQHRQLIPLTHYSLISANGVPKNIGPKGAWATSLQQKPNELMSLNRPE